MRLKYGYFILSIFLAGCATITYKSPPLFDERIKPVRTIAVMPMDVEVYKVTAGGVKELIDEYILEAENNIKAALNNELRDERNYRLVYLPDIKEVTDAKQKSILKDTLALYTALNTSILAHTYPHNPEYFIPLSGIFPDKIKNFDYTFGSNISQINSYTDSDALLFIKGGDYLSSGGRIALMFWATLMTMGNYIPTSAGPPHLSAALVDPKTGDILWYNFFVYRGYNFRNSESVNKFVKILLRGFPNRLK